MIRKLLSVDIWHQIDKLIITVVLSISKIMITLNPHLGFYRNMQETQLYVRKEINEINFLRCKKYLFYSHRKHEFVKTNKILKVDRVCNMSKRLIYNAHKRIKYSKYVNQSTNISKI